jgi:hypothetical protein
MHRFWTIGPPDGLGVLPPGLFDTRDQRLELHCLEPLAGRIDQRLAQALSLDIPVQQDAYAGWQLERLEKLLIQPPAPGDV